MVFVHLHKHQCTKLTPQALRYVFVGYASHQKGYQSYHPPMHQLFVTMKVIFHEDTTYFPEPAFHGEYQKKIQTLDYDDNQNLVNLDLSGITLHYSGDDT